MSRSEDVKQEVRAFYDSVGWQQIGEGLYQNARYEDLRPVSQEYLHRCHLRVLDHLAPAGRFLLDAGSGPIQYPEYLSYSQGYQRRVCVDISHTALVAARDRIGDHGLYVVADVAHLPLKAASMDGLVSLHTVHHLPAEEHLPAFEGFLRCLKPGARAVIVYSWGSQSSLMKAAQPFIRIMNALAGIYRRLTRNHVSPTAAIERPTEAAERLIRTAGTFTFKHNYRWMRDNLEDFPGFDIRVWRSVSTSFLRAFIFRPLFGKRMLRLLFALENLAPHVFGRIGQYPMLLFHAGPEAPSTRERSA
jgi:ubiquinone/menaquinone biosynthesis C-methylase UbiE